MACAFKSGDAVRVTSNHHTRGNTGEVVSTSLTPNGRWQIIVQRQDGQRFSYGAHELEHLQISNVIDLFDALKRSLVKPAAKGGE